MYIFCDNENCLFASLHSLEVDHINTLAYLDSSVSHLAFPAWYNAYPASVVVMVCMSVYVMERGDNESGDRGLEEKRDSSTVVQRGVLVLRCHIPVHQAWPCLHQLAHLYHENPAIEFSTCKSGRSKIQECN